MSPSPNDAHSPRLSEHTSTPPKEQLDKRDVPPPQPRPPPRPNPRSSFDLEPNPFEQSFSNTRSSSGESSERRPSDDKQQNGDDAPPKAKHEGDTPKPVLPSLAALSSPSDGYSWSDLAGSLRSGPLSPAMLPGPQQPQQQQQARIPMTGFDSSSSFGRTGLTPSTGLTPLVGGPVSFPPPSPNTAAFLAMVTNSSSASGLGTSPATITPNTLSAITGMLNPGQNQQQSNAIAPSATTSSNAGGITTAVPQQQQHHSLSVSHLPAQAGYQYNQVPSQHNGQQANGYAPTSAANAANAAANGLFLLSQAHQELTKREEAQARAGQGQVDANNAAQQSKRGSKRKSIDGPGAAPPPSSRAPAGKRPRSNTTRGGRRAKASTDSPELDDDSMDEDEVRAAVEESERQSQANGSKKPETEEEKRRNFLERNRQAALKCRQRKKAWLAQLQAKVEFLSNENERLTSALVSSREEISRLNALLGASGPAQTGVSAVGSQPVSVSVSLPPAGKSIQAQAPQGPPVSVVANGRGYGY